MGASSLRSRIFVLVRGGRRRLLLGLISFVFVAPAFAAEPATGPLAGTTAAHNLLRNNLNAGLPPVADAAVQPLPCPALPALAWSDTVAASAQTWANGCSCDHEPGNPYGENIAWGTAGFVTGPVAAAFWADEVRAPGYDYANRDCPTGAPSFPNCGHYTAMAWSTTTQVGCGFKSCGGGTGCGVGTDWVVCRYNPPGNYLAPDLLDILRPYCTATVTTDCWSGGVCGGGGTPTCAAAADLVCGNPLDGSTAGAANDFHSTYSCTSDPQIGTDVVYRLAPPESGTVTVDLTPTAADLDLFVLTSCDPAGCAGGSESGGAAAEQVMFAATAGETYFVVVEDYTSAGDAFGLTATCPCTAPDGVNLSLTNHTVSGTESFHVCSILTAGTNYTVGSTGNLTLRAGHSVVLTDGFSVQLGGSLIARTD